MITTCPSASTIQIPARPDLNYSTITETRVWDTVYRIDHQINANHSWGGRWITEWSPQANQTNNAAVTLTAAQQEWDRDDTGSIHVNSVLGTNRVNTIRLSLTREDDRFAPNGFPGCQQNLTGFVPMWQATFADCVALNETNMLELYVFASEKYGQAVLVARLDNLGKGASGAAVQNMRLMLGLSET